MSALPPKMSKQALSCNSRKKLKQNCLTETQFFISDIHFHQISHWTGFVFTTGAHFVSSPWRSVLQNMENILLFGFMFTSTFFTFITSYITNVKLLIVSKDILSFNFEEVSPKSIRIKFIFSQIVSYIVDWRHLWVLGPIRLQNLHRCWCWSYLTLGLDSINLGFLFFNIGILG